MTTTTQSNRQWTNYPEMNKDFIDLCLQEIAVSGHEETSLTSNSWKKIREKLNVKYPFVFDVLKNKQKFIKNHWASLKKKYTAFRLCMSHTGNAYNETTGLFTFNDEQWESLKKQNSDCIQFKYKPLEYKNEMHGMFDGILVTFEDAGSAKSLKNNLIDMTAEVDEDDQGDEVTGFTQDSYFEGDNFTQDPSTPTTPFSPSSSGTSKSAKRKRGESNPASGSSIGDLVSAIQAYVGTRIAQHDRSAVGSDEGDQYSMAACMAIIFALQQEVPLVEEKLMLAVQKLSKSLDYRKSFVSLTDSRSRAFFLNSLAFN